MGATELNFDHHWVPFTPNKDFRRDPRVMVAADGMYCTTHDGRQVLDGVSGLWCVGLGHNRRPIAEAITQQLGRLDYATAFQSTNDQAFAAAKAIADMAPTGLDKVMFCNSGSEAAVAHSKSEISPLAFIDLVASEIKSFNLFNGAA